MEEGPAIALKSQGEEVKKLQMVLAGLGYQVGGEDGFFGPRTEEAVISFQSNQGLVANGVVGEETWLALQKAQQTGPPPTEAQQPSTGSKLPLSSSVALAQKTFATDKPISAAALARQLFKQHGEYAGGKAGSLKLAKTAAQKTAGEWLDQIQTLFDPIRLQELSKSDKPAVLNGRLVIIGLSLLDAQLRRQLEPNGVFADLVNEREVSPLEGILTEFGRKRYQEELADSVPTRSDDALRLPEEDLLGRAPFARFLAQRLDDLFDHSGGQAFAVHLYGPWGAGKSSLLNMLREELKRGNRWVIVEFNAWRNQHLRPPWWSLMQRVFQDIKPVLSPWARLKEYWWRFRMGREHIIFNAFIFIALMWVLAYLAYLVIPQIGPQFKTLKAFAQSARDISAILALISTVVGIILAVNRFFWLGSARAAQTYTEVANDPMSQIKERFESLIKWVRSPYRVAIFIDDLDRCQSSYAVELLEGIQTLFREAPVAFVVAADWRWLNACYEEVYQKLEPQVREPGKPLGTLFMEKAFRFSTPMPGIPKELKEGYWRYLLQVKPEQQEADLAVARESAKSKVATAQTEGDVGKLVNDSKGLPFAERRAIREAAAVRLAAPEITERLEHNLTPYRELLDDNPRAMKRLVNTYSANRALATLAEVDVDQHQLVLWTILSSRWPRLAEFLEKNLKEHPSMLEDIRNRLTHNIDQFLLDIGDVPDDLKKLLKNEEVRNVIQGLPGRVIQGLTTQPLSAATVENCRQMRA